MSFIDEQFKALGLSGGNDPKNFLTVKGWNRGMEQQTLTFFEEDKRGLRINYYMPMGAKYYYRRSGNRWQTEGGFHRIRLAEPEGDFKYWQPKDSGLQPYFPPRIITKYVNQEKVDVLFFVEGEKKAWVACQNGIDCIGLPSIHGFYGEKSVDREYLKSLHDDIILVMKAFECTKVVFVTDADTLTVKYEEDKEMTKRPSSFYAAVANFKKALVYASDQLPKFQTPYFCHIKKDYVHQAKGIDDLLNVFSDKRDDIRKDIYLLEKAATFFDCQELAGSYSTKLVKYFGLNSPTNFYDVYKDHIKDEEFKYKGAVHYWNGERVSFLYHEDVNKFMRIGADWCKLVEIPNKYKELEQSIKPWKISEIERDYRTYKGFTDRIKKYDTFCNQPNWNGDYQRDINGCYNLCNPILHRPKEGQFPNTAKFLKHIFQGNGTLTPDGKETGEIGDPFSVAMDYLTILYKKPEHMLPVPVLVSPENRTGKSSFLKWLQSIWGTNVAILGNDQFKMKFNGHYITKFIIAIDEGFLDVDKKSEKERLKQLATADRAFLENKGMNIVEFPYYGKLIISSNDADCVMKMEEGESRWFVVRVPQIPADEVDPDLELKMKLEIPAFLNFLNQREIIHPRKDRLWFKPEWFITDQFKEVVQNTKPYFEKVLDDFIEDQFVTFRVEYLKYDLSVLIELLNKESKYRLDKKQVKDYLKKKRQMDTTQNVERFKYPVGFADPTSVDQIGAVVFVEKVGRPYCFERKNWVVDGEVELQQYADAHIGDEDKTPF